MQRLYKNASSQSHRGLRQSQPVIRAPNVVIYGRGGDQLTPAYAANLMMGE